jgi:membrane-associated phospholipid phosphatase
MEFPQAYDKGILYFFGSLNRPWLDPLVGALAMLGDLWPLACVVLALACLFAWLRRYRFAAAIVCVACFAAGLQLGVARFVDRPRPDVIWRKVALPRSSSFPSAHAMGAVAVYFGGALLGARLIALRRRANAILVAGASLGLLVGLSRPYLGVAYPMDVLAGWIGGLVCALVGSACAGRHSPAGLRVSSERKMGVN